LGGFVIYEIGCGAGFIVRPMIDRVHQRKGHRRAVVIETWRSRPGRVYLLADGG
jgi:hypothetical protein